VSGDVRSRVAEGLAAAVTPERVEALVEAALTATRPVWSTVTCRSCGKTQRHEFVVADAQTAARVLSLLADQGLGRAAVSEAVPVAEGKNLLEMNADERRAYRQQLLERIAAEDGGSLGG
jgi:hypothetical protein